jgi:hypothetical protein|tara:strand:+ start:3670 stop:4485 length:816 start_codon:yes stop_codon:yes gene_type:complete
MAQAQVATSETPPMTTEDLANLEKDDNGLILGKFKSVEDLANSYKELQGKLGQTTTEETTETSTEEETKAEETKTEESEFNAAEVYGEGLADVLSEAGIDAQDISTRFQDSGEISEDDYTKLGEAGFSKGVIDSYLAGLKAQSTGAVEVADSQIKAIQDSVGGAEQYGKLTAWAVDNLPSDQVEAFNALTETGNAASIQLAVNGIQSQYNNAMGKEPSLVSGKAGSSGPSPFRSTAEVVTAMRDARYGKDVSYTENVQRRLADSEVFNVKG